MAVTLERVREAQSQLAGVIRDTPLVPSRWLSDLVGGPVHLKCENLQRAGSFKVRGAFIRLSNLSDEERSAGVVAASAGNHAQGVAVAARQLGISTTVFMPTGAPLPKLMATRAYGAHVELAGETIEDALVAAERFSARTGAVLIHPFDHEDIVTGQATVGLEILDQLPDVRTVVVSLGGGGLTAGIATALAAAAPEVRVIGVQAQAAAAYPASVAAGEPVALTHMATMADGIAVGRPGRIPLDLIVEHRVTIRTVSEDALSRALLMTLERVKLLVEPAGAAAVASIMEQPGGLQPPVVAVLSGGNIDTLLLTHVLQHGMVSAGRYFDLQLRIADHPGALVAVLREVADLGANVLSVEHVRTAPDLGIGEVDVSLQLETRGTEHCIRVHEGLAARGLRILQD